MIYVLLLKGLTFEGYLAVPSTDFRYLDLYYHQFLVMLVYWLNLLLCYEVVAPGWNNYLVTQFF